jgi:surfeit locus 1 family protein
VKHTVFKNIITVLFLIGAFCTLLSLGFWQLNRLAWKNDILAKIEIQENIDPMSVKLDLSDDTEFQSGYIDAQYGVSYLFKISPRTHDGEVGHHVMGKLETDDGTVVLINYGWIKNGDEVAFNDLYPGRAIGYLRTPDQAGAFTPKNSPENDLWYTIHIKDIEKHFKLDDVHPQVLYLTSNAGNMIAFDGLPKPRNKHMQYVIFWFGMSAVWVLMSLLVYFKRVKNS